MKHTNPAKGDALERTMLGARPLDVFLDRLGSVKKNGSGYTAPCPAHEDKDPSLSISEGEDGRVLLHCFSGCTVEYITAALGL